MHSRSVSSLIQNFEDTRTDGGEASVHTEQSDTQSEYVECDDVKSEIKIEPDNVPETVSTITGDAGEEEAEEGDHNDHMFHGEHLWGLEDFHEPAGRL